MTASLFCFSWVLLLATSISAADLERIQPFQPLYSTRASAGNEQNHQEDPNFRFMERPWHQQDYGGAAGVRQRYVESVADDSGVYMTRNGPRQMNMPTRDSDTYIPVVPTADFWGMQDHDFGNSHYESVDPDGPGPLPPLPPPPCGPMKQQPPSDIPLPPEPLVVPPPPVSASSEAPPAVSIPAADA
eukprot:GILK01003974.1.p1 GENE.GILK01003974.1~~GILK01003974.1.p1  ORF type:complete len:205 (+),score=14.22 GILK01003974.1:57-617(+)